MTILLTRNVNIMMVYPLMENMFSFQIKCAANTCISPNLMSARDIFLTA